jgi:hypothetical protein
MFLQLVKRELIKDSPMKNVPQPKALKSHLDHGEVISFHVLQTRFGAWVNTQVRYPCRIKNTIPPR